MYQMIERNSYGVEYHGTDRIIATYTQSSEASKKRVDKYKIPDILDCVQRDIHDCVKDVVESRKDPDDPDCLMDYEKLKANGEFKVKYYFDYDTIGYFLSCEFLNNETDDLIYWYAEPTRRWRDFDGDISPRSFLIVRGVWYN